MFRNFPLKQTSHLPARRLLLCALAFCTCGLPTSWAQNAQRRHDMVLEYLKQQAAQVSAGCLENIETLDDWKQQRVQLRQQLLDVLGLDPLPTRTPLQAKITGTVQRPQYTIEKLVFQSQPGLYVTGNYYLPRNAKRPLPTILYLCGHSPGPYGAKVHYQDRAVWFAEHGYACLILDTLEFAEVAGLHHGIHDLNMWYWLSLGYTPAGTEVWNAMRALDYLQTRDEVDMQRIGVTGISGGGAITWFLAAVDDRVAVAAPICSTYTVGSQAQHWTAAGQCDCIYYHNTYLQDFPVVAALIAPRPLLICSGQRDGDFPPDGYHAVYQRALRIYELYAQSHDAPRINDAPRIQEVDDDVGHSDAPLFRSQTRQWMNAWLKHDNTPVAVVPNPESGPEAGETLACLHELPHDAVNYQIHRQFIPTPEPTAPQDLAVWKTRKETLQRQLREHVFRGFPTESAPFDAQALRSSGGWSVRYANYQAVEFDTERNVRIRAQLWTRKDGAENVPLLVYAKRAGDSIYAMDLDELLPLLGRCNVLAINPRLTEHPVTAFEYAEIERTASWAGRTVSSMQVWDILRSVEWAIGERKLKPESIAIFGKGEMGINGLYAAVLDERIDHVILDTPPGSHWQGPALLNVLRYTDVAEAAGLLAPRKISSLSPLPPQFDLTKQIYRLHDAAGHVRESTNLPTAVGLGQKPD